MDLRQMCIPSEICRFIRTFTYPSDEQIQKWRVKHKEHVEHLLGRKIRDVRRCVLAVYSLGPFCHVRHDISLHEYVLIKQMLLTFRTLLRPKVSSV